MQPVRFITRTPLTTFVFFLVLGLLTYANAIHHPFVHDDVVFILNNPHIKDLSLASVFQPKSIDGPAAGLINVYYRPLVELYYRLVAVLFGLHAWVYHLINILVHGVNAFLVFTLLKRCGAVRPNEALFIAVLFLVHPVQTEAVACISGISNLLLLSVMLGSFLLYLKGRVSGERGSYAGCLSLLLMGCLVKEQMIILPLLIGLYEIFVIPSGERKWGKMTGLFATLAAYFLVRRIMLGFSFTGIIDPYGEYVYRFASIPRSLLTYIGIIVWPAQLHYYRSLDVLQPNTAAWITLTVLAAIIGWVLYKTKTAPRRMMLFGLGWFFIALLPMLNIIPLVNEYSTILNFEHFVYIPLIGLLLALVIFIREWILPHVPGKGAGLAIALCLLCVPLAWKQNTYWGSEIKLFTRTLRFQESGRVRILLAKALYFRGDYGPAMAEYESARVILQGYIDKTPVDQVRAFYRGYLKEIYFDLAHCYEALQNSSLAIKMYHQALEIEPADIVLYNNLAVVYIKEKNFTEAVALLEKALALQPRSPLTRQNLAYCYVQLGRPEAADDLFRNEGSIP